MKTVLEVCQECRKLKLECDELAFEYNACTEIKAIQFSRTTNGSSVHSPSDPTAKAAAKREKIKAAFEPLYYEWENAYISAFRILLKAIRGKFLPVATDYYLDGMEPDEIAANRNMKTAEVKKALREINKSLKFAAEAREWAESQGLLLEANPA